MSYNTNIKCLPCKTQIMCGTCPYFYRCQYIHDPRLTIQNLQIINRKKNNGEYNEIHDAWYWPKMNNSSHYYNIQSPNIYQDIFMEDISLYSIWNHFIFFLGGYQTNNYISYNMHTGRKRLPVFIYLSTCNN